MPLPPHRQRTRTLAVAGIALSCLALVILVDLLPRRARAYDFSHAWLSARLMHTAGALYRTPLHTQAPPGISFELGPGECATQPPWLLYVYQPLAWLTPSAAFGVAVAIQGVSLVGILVLAGRLLPGRFSWAEWVLILGLSCCSVPVLRHFYFTQVQLPIMALLMLGYWCWRQGSPGWASALFGLTGLLKLYPLAVAPLPLLGADSGRQRWRVLAAGLVGLTVGVALPGWRVWQEFVAQALPHLSGFSDGSYYNFTLLSLSRGIARVLGGHDSPLWVSRLASVCGLAASAALLLWAWYRCAASVRSNDAPAADAGFSLLLVSAVVCSPTAWTHYLVLLIYPLLCLADQSKTAVGPQRRRCLGLLLLCLLLFNAAGTNLLPGSTGLVQLLVCYLPLLPLLLLYGHFAGQLRAAGATPGAPSK